MPEFDIDAALNVRPILPEIEISCAFSINTGNTYSLEQNLEERGYDDGDIAFYLGADGQVQDDYLALERNGMEILNRTFQAADHGHSDEDLVGHCWVTLGTPAWKFLRDEIENHDEGFSTTSGTIHSLLAGGPDIVYRGVSEMGCACLDLSIHFYDTDEVKRWMAIEDGDEPMPPEHLNPD